MVEILSFDEAIEDSRQYTKRHLLLGNGFSIACQPEIFNYESLLKKADFSSAQYLREIFELLETTDFEYVIKTITDESYPIPIYDSTLDDTASKRQKDITHLKNILIKTIANNHPKYPHEISNKQFQSCRQFLSHFLGSENKFGKVYSLNYDLLLYWTLMNVAADWSNSSIQLYVNDGFGNDSAYLIWLGENNKHSQSIHYLHGALHLFSTGTKLKKLRFNKNANNKSLGEQTRKAMEMNEFPLYVAEGQSNHKLKKIKSSNYLYHSYKSFIHQMSQMDDALFIFGHKLAENDRHIWGKIGQGKIKQVYVSLHGNFNNEENKKMIATVKSLNQDRTEQYPLKVNFYKAASAKVWDNSVDQPFYLNSFES